MDLTTSVILIVIFIVIQQVAILYAINKIERLSKERDIYKDRLADKIECDRLKEADKWIKGNIIVKQDFTAWLKRREIYEQAKRSGVISETAVMMGEYENE